VSSHLWLVLAASGAYSAAATHVTIDGEELDDPTESLRLNANLGLRITLTEDAPVEVSVLMLGELGKSVDGYGQATRYGGSLGLALERELADRFGLRLAAMLASAGYHKGEYGTVEQSGVYGQLSLNPWLQARFLF